MSEQQLISILEIPYGTKIINRTHMNLIISEKPKKPKRKITDFAIVRPNSFIEFASKLSYKDLYISFEEVIK